jgi:hypothetical protein
MLVVTVAKNHLFEIELTILKIQVPQIKKELLALELIHIPCSVKKNTSTRWCQWSNSSQWQKKYRRKRNKIIAAEKKPCYQWKKVFLNSITYLWKQLYFDGWIYATFEFCYKTPFQVIVEKKIKKQNSKYYNCKSVYHTRNFIFPELTRPNGLNQKGI